MSETQSRPTPMPIITPCWRDEAGNVLVCQMSGCPRGYIQQGDTTTCILDTYTPGKVILFDSPDGTQTQTVQQIPRTPATLPITGGASGVDLNVFFHLGFFLVLGVLFVRNLFYAD